jgi:hypothetical protein
MKTRVLVSVLIALVLCGGKAYAQDDYFFGFAYTPVLPVGNTKDFAAGWSWRGVTMEGRRIVKPNVSIGFSLGWQVMNAETDSVVGFEGDAVGFDVQGYQIRTINSFPLMVMAHYFFGQRGGARPYLGGGAGLSFSEHRVNLGGVIIEDDTWPFTLAADAGIAFPAGWRSAAFAFARFHWQAAAGSLESQTYFAFGVGVAWQ